MGRDRIIDKIRVTRRDMIMDRIRVIRGDRRADVGSSDGIGVI